MIAKHQCTTTARHNRPTVASSGIKDEKEIVFRPKSDVSLICTRTSLLISNSIYCRASECLLWSRIRLRLYICFLLSVYNTVLPLYCIALFVAPLSLETQSVVFCIVTWRYNCWIAHSNYVTRSSLQTYICLIPAFDLVSHYLLGKAITTTSMQSF